MLRQRLSRGEEEEQAALRVRLETTREAQQACMCIPCAHHVHTMCIPCAYHVHTAYIPCAYRVHAMCIFHTQACIDEIREALDELRAEAADLDDDDE